jgi:hypothetical protein
MSSQLFHVEGLFVGLIIGTYVTVTAEFHTQNTVRDSRRRTARPRTHCLPLRGTTNGMPMILSLKKAASGPVPPTSRMSLAFSARSRSAKSGHAFVNNDYGSMIEHTSAFTPRD